MERPALCLRRVEWRGGGADIDERKPPGVAVRQYSHAFLDQWPALTPNRLAMSHVVVGKIFRGNQRQGLSFCNRLALAHPGSDFIHRVDRVNRGRTCRLESLVNRVNLLGKLFQIPTAKA